MTLADDGACQCARILSLDISRLGRKLLYPAVRVSTVRLPSELASGLDEVSRRFGVARDCTLLAGFAVLADRYGDEHEHEHEQAVAVSAGEFVGAAVVRVALADDPPFADVLAQVGRQGSAKTDNPVISSRFEPRSREGRACPTRDLALTIRHSAGDTQTWLEHPAAVPFWPARWHSLLAAIIADPDVRASRLGVLPEGERSLLLGDWCQTSSSAPTVSLVNQLVEKWAERTPDAMALSQNGSGLTYSDLDARANRLAHWLRERGVGPDVAVALFGGSTARMLTGMLAVLKAGGYYIPMDASAPPARTAELLSDCAPRLVLTQGLFMARLPELPNAADLVHDLDRCDLGRYPTSSPQVAVHEENLAYVMHTSGSTGRPKGVAMPHRALVRIADWYANENSIPPGAHVLQLSSFSFDASFCEIFGGWRAGARVVLLPHEGVRRDPESLIELLAAEQIDHLEAPYSGLLNIAHWAVRYPGPEHSRLRTIVTGSEQLLMAPDMVNWLARLPGCALRNGYGPSETSVATTYWLRGSPADWPQVPPIGRPITNARLYLLDDALQPSPVGVTGEIYVGGTILARGYVGRPNLTAQRFIADPFSPVPGSRMYRTGDLARHRPDGELEFLGRADDQVKIRGHRVELGEIEARLLDHPGVSEVAVAVREDAAGPSLTGYVVASDAASPPGSQDLRDYAERILPDFMVPARFVTVFALPRTASGKLDRAWLRSARPDSAEPGRVQPTAGQTPARAGQTPTRAGQQPSNTAAALLDIWREVLAVPQIGISDDFFDLGGHSLLATRVVAKVRRDLGKRVLIGDIFEYPTVELLAARIDEATAGLTSTERR